MKKDVVAGLGEIGLPILKILSKKEKIVGYDIDKKFKPDCIVIHSTIPPGTTERLQKKLSSPIIYSATRGVHKRMLRDLKRYTKFFAISNSAPKKQWATKTFSKKMKNSGIKTKQMSKPETLELAKILCDTSYFGW